ncbi:MAG: hypothetical protein M5U05_19645 [Anaerolineales bacterium]|nr:hypothetical protein [Anaerolineales bacterium]
MTAKPTQTSIRLSRDGQILRRLLARKLGLSQTAVIELGIRRLAELENVKVPKPKRKPQKPTGSP